jgi:hypothetical protein
VTLARAFGRRQRGSKPGRTMADDDKLAFFLGHGTVSR